MDRFERTGAWAALAAGVTLALAGCGKSAPNAASAPAAAPSSSVSATAAAAGPDDAAAAKAFLEGVYAHYKSSPKAGEPMFDYTSTAVVDPELAQLLKDDNRVLKGEVGDIDADWICDCQDFESIRATIAVQSASATEAKATADFVDVGIADAKPNHNSFDLAKVNGAWRIHDVRETGRPSLREVLQAEIKRLSSAKSPSSRP